MTTVINNKAIETESVNNSSIECHKCTTCGDRCNGKVSKPKPVASRKYDKFNCECGGRYTRKNKLTHFRSQKHQRYLESEKALDVVNKTIAEEKNTGYGLYKIMTSLNLL